MKITVARQEKSKVPKKRMIKFFIVDLFCLASVVVLYLQYINIINEYK